MNASLVIFLFFIFFGRFDKILHTRRRDMGSDGEQGELETGELDVSRERVHLHARTGKVWWGCSTI